MAIPGEVVLRPRVCLGCECHALFFICACCDRGHRYCSLECRSQARRRQHCEANRRHQQSLEGRLDHRDRQRAYRHRRTQARVTDQGSHSVISPASSGSEETVAPAVAVVSLIPHSPQRGLRLCCRVCGRAGRFVDPFPRIPWRR